MTAKKIKIFVDAHSFDKEFQGAQTFVRELYTQLMTDHPELDIYFGAIDVNNIQSIFPNLPAANILPYKKRKIGLLRFIFDIPEYLKIHQFDFAHFQYIAPRKVGNCKYIVTLHDVLFNDFKAYFPLSYRLIRNLTFGRSIRNADIKTTVSDYSKARICHHYHLTESEIHIIPNAVNKALNQCQDSKKGAIDLVKKKYGIENYILCTSRIEPRKNQLLLLKTYLKLGLDRKGIALVLIGKESIHIPELTQLISQLNPEQKQMFHWIPQVGQADLASFYRACKLFVYPSHGEGFGIPPLEAAVCHAPVLCSSATAMQDFYFFEPYVFDPDNRNELEEKLLWLLTAPPPAIHLEKIANEVVLQYNWQKSSEAFYDLLMPDTYKQKIYETEDSDFGYAGNS